MSDEGLVLTRHKLSVDDYHRMASAGILSEHDRVELLDGEIIDMAPIGQDHVATVNLLNRALVLAFADRALVSTQNPIRIDRYNEPQPDFAVLRNRPDAYRHGECAGPADVLLLIEVADSSLRYDRSIKLQLYAKAGVGEVWIVDLQRRVVDAYRRPVGGAYEETVAYERGEAITPGLAAGVTIAVDDILG